MRRLLCVPIIHSQADMGSAGAALSRASSALTGELRWARHEEVAGRFWESVSAYLRSFDPRQLKVYQDGLAAGGPTGRRIVQEAAARGSKNYRLVLELVHGGAELRKTEDAALLLQEQENILGLLQPGRGQDKARNAEQYQQRRDRLMAERDRFIAGAIDATLKEGEAGVLFIGASHDVAAHLPGDVRVEAVKDREKVRAYFDELLWGHDERKLEELSLYLAAPVEAP